MRDSRQWELRSDLGVPDGTVESREEGSREGRAAASPGRWAASGAAEHWLMGRMGERRSAREWTLGAETVSSEAMGFGIHQL